MSPEERYQSDLNLPGFQRDSAQAEVVARLQNLYLALLRHQQRSPWQRAIDAVGRLFGLDAGASPRGLYLWGGVGRGKTYLMDVFFEALPFENKMRTHFHRFMRRVHAELKQLKSLPDPLEKVADTLAREARVLCFDEFFVADITDAMILANLLQGLFKRGVVLVATSNIPPDELYKDGLQRARFMPAIALLQAHMDVVNVDGGIDYRLRALTRAPLYHCPADRQAEADLDGFFTRLAPDSASLRRDVDLDIEGRAIRARRVADDVVWFDFVALCDGPRSQNDYIEIAREYHAVLVSGVPAFRGNNDDQARRFIHLVDEFYDRQVKLVLSAEAPLPELYRNGRLGFEFARTVSRLQEMQSEEYLARAHRA